MDLGYTITSSSIQEKMPMVEYLVCQLHSKHHQTIQTTFELGKGGKEASVIRYYT